MTVEALLCEMKTVEQYAAGSGSAPAVGMSGDQINKMDEICASIARLETQLGKVFTLLEKANIACPAKAVAAAPAAAKPAAKPAAAPAADDDMDDLFDDDEDDAEAEALKQKRIAEYAAKKSKKPALVAKSSIVLDVKPWDDETDLEAMQAKVKSIEMDGLIWGAAKFVPLAYGIKKLQIMCVVEDDKVSIDELTEKIEGFEDLVQSVDIAAFNKV